MDPIIKTTRIAPNAFTLSLRHPKKNDFQLEQNNQEKSTANQNASTQQAKTGTHTTLFHEPLLNTETVDRLISATSLEAETVATATPTSNPVTTQQEIEAIFQEARQQGYQKGLEEGKNQNQQQLNKSLQQINDLIHALSDAREATFQELEDSAVEVVFEAVTKILGYAATDKQIAYNVVREAIEQVKGRDHLIIRVSNKDYDLVKAALAHAGAEHSLAKNINIVADNLVQLGGCLIETEAGSLDARLEIQLQRLKDILLGTRRTPSDG